MAQILVRELDERVVRTLKRRAKARRRSLEGEVRAILEGIAEREERRDEFMEELKSLQAELSNVRTTDSVELLREAREERDAWLDSL